MVAYIKTLAEQFAAVLRTHPVSPTCEALRSGLNEELAKLDARDFLPAARHDFVHHRKILLRMQHYSLDEQAFIRNLLIILDQYGGDGSRAVSRSFGFIRNVALRMIIERDYRELSLILFPSEAWKSTVVMAGSILEAILFDLLTCNAGRIASAHFAKGAPKDKGGADLPMEKWKLGKLIEVSVTLGLLPSERGKSIDQSLRDYRNFVHPNVEVRAAHPCSEAEALMAKGALDGVCNHLSQ